MRNVLINIPKKKKKKVKNMPEQINTSACNNDVDKTVQKEIVNESSSTIITEQKEIVNESSSTIITEQKEIVNDSSCSSTISTISQPTSATEIPKIEEQKWKRLVVSKGSYLWNIIVTVIKHPDANCNKDSMTIKINAPKYKGTYKICFKPQDDDKDIIGLDMFEEIVV